ncbi:MAG: hypothetical protein ACE5EU_10075 [Paracoccaceae bacterium]
MVLSRSRRPRRVAIPAPRRNRPPRWFPRPCALLLALALPSCGGPPEAPEDATVVGRMVTPELWAGAATFGDGAFPAVDVQSGDGRVTIRGPIETRHPVDGSPVLVYERIALVAEGRRRQLLTVTQDRAGLGRVLDHRTGLPERRFTGDVVFPLGVWAQGEVREFEATEYTLFGPARRLVTLEILDIDHVYEGVAHSLSYRLSIRDEIGRVLDCEVSVYSPGRGLVAFEASSYWRTGGGCTVCPCPG